jgi:hypothetical protein
VEARNERKRNKERKEKRKKQANIKLQGEKHC